LLAVVSVPILLPRGEPAGWSFVPLACGIIVSGAQAIVVVGIDFEIARRLHVAAFVGASTVWFPIAYLPTAVRRRQRLAIIRQSHLLIDPTRSKAAMR
jgi:hypothetical protein